MDRLGNKDKAEDRREGREGADRARQRGADQDRRGGGEVRPRGRATRCSSRRRPAAAAGACASPATRRNCSPGCTRRKAEAEAAFKDGSVYLEKYLERPRHVEVQLLGDRHGNVVHLCERDCSLQRRHQKLVEESPAPNLPDKVRQEICDAAVRLAKAAGYYTAGTCEFLVDQKNNFYFIEVNARIQVEHPVTELVTGIDLIREQIRIAAGEKLRFTQKDIVQRGLRHRVPHQRRGPGQRLPPRPGHDHDAGSRRAGRACGSTRTSWPATACRRTTTRMVAKLLVHQPTRAEAIAVMRRALREFVVEGIQTTIPILQKIFDTPEFIDGKVDTTFIERSLMPAQKG